MIDNYRKLASAREKMGVPPLPLDADQTKSLTELLEKGELHEGEGPELIKLLTERVPPGVDEASYVKATWLKANPTFEGLKQAIKEPAKNIL